MLTGYLANWKIFDPRKLIPFSIEFWSAPIAVITEMTEKTPMVIPNIVSPERSLFTPNEPSAIFMISLNCISIIEMTKLEGRRTKDARSPNDEALKARPIFGFWASSLIWNSPFGFHHFHHSYRSAVTGSRRDAAQAGAKPETRPVTTDTIMLATTSPKENWIGNDGNAFPIPKHIK